MIYIYEPLYLTYEINYSTTEILIIFLFPHEDSLDAILGIGNQRMIGLKDIDYDENRQLQLKQGSFSQLLYIVKYEIQYFCIIFDIFQAHIQKVLPIVSKLVNLIINFKRRCIDLLIFIELINIQRQRRLYEL